MTGQINYNTFHILQNDLRIQEKKTVKKKKAQVKTTELESFQQVLQQDIQCISSFKETRDRLSVLRKNLQLTKEKVERINVLKKIKFM